MITNELIKNIKLYTPQFEDLSYQIFGDYRLHRTSLEIDGITFKTKYILNNHLEDNTTELKEEYIKYNKEFCDLFTKIAIEVISIHSFKGKMKNEKIKDILISDINMGAEYTSYTMHLYSDDESFVQRIDESFNEEGNVTNIFPNKYFRYKVDSYNDGIAKAYPELFEKRTQNTIGTGDDADVFCHSVTLQVGERCSLNCTYCFAGGTHILLPDGNTKTIEDVKIGDIVMGFDVRKLTGYPNKNIEVVFKPVKVTNIMNHVSEVIEIEHPYIETTYATPDHSMLTHSGKYIPLNKLDSSISGLMRYNHGKALPFWVYNMNKTRKTMKVYNLTTESGNYIANRLLVHNCYQFNKSEMRMSWDTAKTFIDNLLEDKYDYVNQYNSPAIILEFIGGEPLLEMSLINQTYEYFLRKAYEMNHPYFTMHRLSICSNGMQYFDKPVQEFFQKYSDRISFNISIDGNKELHDSCRIQPNGEGSYDVDIAALKHYNEHYSNERNSKMTLAPNNIKYLFDSVKDFIKNGTTIINLNCVFEEGWTKQLAHEEYIQLIKLADYIIDNKLENLYISIFRETPDGPLSKKQDNTSCGGAGSMLAVRANGDIYPCLRYMPSSVGNNVKDLKMGNVKDGMIGRKEGSDVLKMLDSITRRSSTDDICYNCPIANACMTCIALGHTVFGTPNKRTTFTCDMVKAEHLANVYYWNKLLAAHPEYKFKVREIKIPKEDILSIITQDEYEDLTLITANAMIAKMK